jgi:osmotically-inducible protein OsmY
MCPVSQPGEDLEREGHSDGGNIMGTTMVKTDAEIQRDVMQELKWDQRIDETEVGVQVKSGIVTLTGDVKSYLKKVAALEAAHRVPGVLDVANELEVQLSVPWSKSDTDIAQMVRNALVWDAVLPDEKIKSTVAKGWVTLEGEVDYWYQRNDAARVLGRLNGVRGVTNLLAVKSKAAVDAARLRSSIEAALKRQIEREARHIDIKVKDGVVTLGGTVHSWAEKDAIENVARFAPGVCRLDNELIVSSFS